MEHLQHLFFTLHFHINHPLFADPWLRSLRPLNDHLGIMSRAPDDGVEEKWMMQVASDATCFAYSFFLCQPMVDSTTLRCFVNQICLFHNNAIVCEDCFFGFHKDIIMMSGIGDDYEHHDEK